MVALGVFPAAIGYAAWTYALGRFGAARAANFLYLVPPVAALVGYAALGESLSALTLVGGADRHYRSRDRRHVGGGAALASSPDDSAELARSKSRLRRRSSPQRDER